MGLLDRIFGTQPPPRPTATVTDTQLGERTWKSRGWWEGAIAHDGGLVRLAVGGDHAGPDAAVIRAAARTKRELGRLRAEAAALVLRELEDHAPGAEPAVCHLWPDKPREFWVELHLEGDDDGIWRVEFGEAGPLCSGRDE